MGYVRETRKLALVFIWYIICFSTMAGTKHEWNRGKSFCHLYHRPRNFRRNVLHLEGWVYRGVHDHGVMMRSQPLSHFMKEGPACVGAVHQEGGQSFI
jgi:hypothetical protein